MAITHRVGGSPLTNAEIDANFDYVDGRAGSAISAAAASLQPANNLSDVSSVVASRASLGLGSAAVEAASAFASAAQGAKADSAVQTSTATVDWNAVALRFKFNTTDATRSNRFAIQDRSANQNTVLQLIPNGTSVTSNYRAYSNSDLDAAQNVLQAAQVGSVTVFDAAILGTATQGTMELRVGGVKAFGIDANKNVSHVAAIADNSQVYHSASGSFTETIPDNVTGYTLVIIGATSGTLTMPANPVDGQIIEVACSGAITSITVSPNSGQSLVNAPTSMAAGSGFSYRYKGATSTWYRRY